MPRSSQDCERGMHILSKRGNLAAGITQGRISIKSVTKTKITGSEEKVEQVNRSTKTRVSKGKGSKGREELRNDRAR